MSARRTSNTLVWTSVVTLALVLSTVQCSSNDDEPCQGPSCAGQCTGCGAPSCCHLGACVQDGQVCGTSGLVCTSGTCKTSSPCGSGFCSLPGCCHEDACVLNGAACGGSGLTCSNGSCGGSTVCGNVACGAPKCCHDNVCYENSLPCGGSGLTCNSGTCGSASDCDGVSCGAPSCCYNDACYQHGQVCGPGLICQNGSCKSGPCGGALCDPPSCCHENACYPDGQACGASGLTCSDASCGAAAWNCTMEPGGGEFHTPHSDGCMWKWDCGADGKRQLYCETISTVEHTCTCKKDGVEEKRFKSAPICAYDDKTIAPQVNADCGWNLPTP